MIDEVGINSGNIFYFDNNAYEETTSDNLSKFAKIYERKYKSNYLSIKKLIKNAS